MLEKVRKSAQEKEVQESELKTEEEHELSSSINKRSENALGKPPLSHQIPIDQTQKGTQLMNVQTERSNTFMDDANNKRSLSYEHHVQMLFDSRRVSENLSRRAMNIDNGAERGFVIRESLFTKKGQRKLNWMKILQKSFQIHFKSLRIWCLLKLL